MDSVEVSRWDGKSDKGYVEATYTLKGVEYGGRKTNQTFTEEFAVNVRKPQTTSRNTRYDTSRASSKKIKPTNLQAFKENARQANEALAEGVRRNALEVHYKGITDEVYKYYWNGATFQRDKVKQDMAKKYGKKAGVYKASFKKPKDWE